MNDPDPSPETIERVLGRYSFRDVHVAYDNLMSLANANELFARHLAGRNADAAEDGEAKTH